ncbi:hypothetical protein ABZ949_02350 [Micromonospora tulbaghiae]|uniref:hypothetical protein n=1 Tax=Micromonospora tulbaghiae TaxID=479978 RepID=UPI0033E3510E
MSRIARLLPAVDLLAHILHRRHLIPTSWMQRVCDRYEGALLTETPPDTGRARVVVPVGYRCPHLTVTSSTPAHINSVATFCGCRAEPIFR